MNIFACEATLSALAEVFYVAEAHDDGGTASPSTVVPAAAEKVLKKTLRAAHASLDNTGRASLARRFLGVCALRRRLAFVLDWLVVSGQITEAEDGRTAYDDVAAENNKDNEDEKAGVPPSPRSPEGGVALCERRRRQLRRRLARLVALYCLHDEPALFPSDPLPWDGVRWLLLSEASNGSRKGGGGGDACEGSDAAEEAARATLWVLARVNFDEVPWPAAPPAERLGARHSLPLWLAEVVLYVTIRGTRGTFIRSGRRRSLSRYFACSVYVTPHARAREPHTTLMLTRSACPSRVACSLCPYP